MGSQPFYLSGSWLTFGCFDQLRTIKFWGLGIGCSRPCKPLFCVLPHLPSDMGKIWGAKGIGNIECSFGVKSYEPKMFKGKPAKVETSVESTGQGRKFFTSTDPGLITLTQD